MKKAAWMEVLLRAEKQIGLEPDNTSDASRRHSTSRYQTADGVRSVYGMYEGPGKRTQYD